MRKTMSMFATVFLASWMLAPTAGGKEPKPKLAEGCTGCDQTADQSAGNGNGDARASVSNCICLVYPYAFYASHWSYYAADCRTDPPSPMSYDAPPESALGSCGATPPCGVCFAAPPPLAVAPGRGLYGRYYVHEETRQQGLAVKGKRDHDIKMPVASGAKVTSHLFAEIILSEGASPGANRKIYAKLFIVTLEPVPGLPAFTKPLGVGVEIKKLPDDKSIVITVKPDKVTPVGPAGKRTKQNAFTRCIQIHTDVQPLTFQVITNTKLPLPARPRAARQRASKR